MGIWEAMEYLTSLVDASDPDTDLSQVCPMLYHAFYSLVLLMMIPRQMLVDATRIADS
jgi:hypothetical protein